MIVMLQKSATCFAIVCLLSGCAATRTTTTPQTAVEQALLSQAVEQSVESLNVKGQEGRTFYVQGDEIFALSAKDEFGASYVAEAITHRLLSAGMHLASGPDEAEIVVYPRVHFVAVDDRESLLGIPSIPLPIPGVGTVNTPEIALFKFHGQYGRARLSLFAVDEESGQLLFDAASQPTQKHYSRWTVLVILGWRTTNLGSPF